LKFKVVKKNKKNIKMNCSDVAVNPSRYCKRSAIATTCQSSCNSCDVCEDSPLRFRLKGYKFNFIECKKVKKKPAKFCSLAGVDLACPRSCGLCVE